MTTRRTASIPLALVAVFSVTILPAIRATAAGDETDWAKAFEKAKRESPGFAVESVEEFRKLTDHYQNVLADGVTIKSFDLPNGDQIRCVEISSQRSLSASGHPLQLAPGTLPDGGTVTNQRMPGSIDQPRDEFGLDGTKDAAGNERACPAQSFPKLMPRLENLYHFRRLEDLFQKTPGSGGGRSAAPSFPVGLVQNSLPEPPHEYAHAYQFANNIGMSADFNLWSPNVADTDEFSLSQLWVARGSKTDNSLQTVETGWQNYPQKYHDSRSRLFIFYTSANYQTGTKCYNLDCAAFVQTDSSVVLGGGWSPSSYSTQGGLQFGISLAYFRNTSPPYDWWLRYGDTWVGYYPNSLFNSQGLANYSNVIDFGGEIVNDSTGGLHTTTEMGSGRFPSEGFGQAAYTKKIQFWDPSNTRFNATGLIRDVTNASYYDLSLRSSSDSNWLNYFYFGGPGRVGSSCTAIALSPASLPNGTAGAAYGPVTLTPTSGTSPFTFNVAGLPSGLQRTSAASGLTVSIGGTPVAAFSGSVTVNGTDANGCPFSQVFSLTVSVKVTGPTASFTWSPSPAVTGQPVQFTDTSTGSPTGWAWSFGDSSGSLLRNPSHTFAGPGPYAVTLTASNASGASTKAQTVTLTAPPSGDVVKTIPIVLDVAGRGGVRFSTELTLGNRGTSPAALQITYTPATSLGASGRGTVPESLAAGRQLVLPDAIAYLRSKGLPIPTGSNQGGALQIAFSGLSSPDVAFAGARTTAPAGGGSAGLSYPAVRQDEGLVGDAYLYGLRETSTDRSNLALVNLNTASSVVLRVTLFSGEGGGASLPLPDVFLQAGQWSQLGSVLSSGASTSGYAKIQIVSGTGPYFAYAVFNDNATNDGSFVSPVAGTPVKEQQTLPVLVESPTFQSELVLSNPSAQPLTATLSYVESLAPGLGAGGAVAESLQAFEQKIIPNAIDYLRKKGVSIGASGQATFAGALTATFTSQGAPSWGFVGARTASHGDGGEYGLFYRAVGASQAGFADTWIFGLQQNATTRSNVAVVNIGDTGTPITVRFDIFDGNTGLLVGSTAPTTLSAGAWTQISALLTPFGVSNGYVHVVRSSGTSHFAAYGVLNDGATPSSGRTNDGSYVASANR